MGLYNLISIAPKKKPPAKADGCIEANLLAI
jgi:hypothetical protein